MNDNNAQPPPRFTSTKFTPPPGAGPGSSRKASGASQAPPPISFTPTPFKWTDRANSHGVNSSTDANMRAAMSAPPSPRATSAKPH